MYPPVQPYIRICNVGSGGQVLGTGGGLGASHLWRARVRLTKFGQDISGLAPCSANHSFVVCDHYLLGRSPLTQADSHTHHPAQETPQLSRCALTGPSRCDSECKHPGDAALHSAVSERLHTVAQALRSLRPQVLVAMACCTPAWRCGSLGRPAVHWAPCWSPCRRCSGRRAPPQ